MKFGPEMSFALRGCGQLTEDFSRFSVPGFLFYLQCTLSLSIGQIAPIGAVCPFPLFLPLLNVDVCTSPLRPAYAQFPIDLPLLIRLTAQGLQYPLSNFCLHPSIEPRTERHYFSAEQKLALKHFLIFMKETYDREIN